MSARRRRGGGAFGRGLGGGFALRGLLSGASARLGGGLFGLLASLGFAGGVDDALTGAQFFLRQAAGRPTAAAARLRLLRTGRRGVAMATFSRRRRGEIT